MYLIWKPMKGILFAIPVLIVMSLVPTYLINS